MSIITISNRGDFSKTFNFLRRILRKHYLKKLEDLAQEGVEALSAATPVDTGLTAASWHYRIVDDGESVSIRWYNTNESHGVPIVVLLYYGHATKYGKYVEGRDFITPAMAPILDRIAEQAWKEVTSE